MPQRRAVAKDKQLEPETLEITSLSLESGPLSVDDQYYIEKHNLRVKQWRESPFAIGLTEPTWLEESKKAMQTKPSVRRFGTGTRSHRMSVLFGLVCSRLAARRVGNMSVLKSSEELVEEITVDEETGETISPNIHATSHSSGRWTLLADAHFHYVSSHFAASWYTFQLFAKGTLPFALIAVWAVCTVGLVVSLALTACTDPGILYKYPKPPPQDENTWRWTDQAVSYRPRRAQYDPDCAVVVEGFDHTCPWTGTAIGKKNMLYFQTFVCLVFVCIFLDLYVVTMAI